ncbi:MAG: Na+/H+ antiporter subunit E [Desulfurococcus sp.]|uniref:Na+/H+ antiporter subunit E n=1 Tax=Desulfurococcus sp. TaxID=51678 RepID=UPI003175FA0B
MNKSSILLALLLSIVVYLVYTGVFDVVELTLAIVIGLVTAYIFKMELTTGLRGVSIRRIILGVYYLIKYFTIIEAKAHWSVVKVILSRNINVQPAIVRVPYKVSSDYSVVFIANSITNTPGTVVVDLDQEKKVYYVHWLTPTDVSDEGAYREVSSEFEKYLSRIFG